MDDFALEAIRKLEIKVDRLLEGMARFLVVEERQQSQGTRIGKLEQDMAALSSKMQSGQDTLDKQFQGIKQEINTVRSRLLGGLAVLTFLMFVYKSGVLVDLHSLLPSKQPYSSENK